jgi:hypothetical protein
MDTMLRAFLQNQEFCEKYKIPKDEKISIFKAEKSKVRELVVLAKIIHNYEDENTAPLYQQIINLLNSKDDNK